MNKIIKNEQLNPNVYLLEIEASRIAKKVQPGQFVIVKVDEKGERVPLTIHDKNISTGTITIIVQAVGKTTKKLSTLKANDYVDAVVGPLGQATHFDQAKNICVIGGGVGLAIAYPSAKYLKEQGKNVTIISGFRNQEMVILEDKLKQNFEKSIVMTDDGSNGNQGYVTTALADLLEKDDLDLVIAIGPIPMMNAVCKITKEKNIKTIVSLNPIMIDGTGMCGGCRVMIDGKVKFACVDGPDFDGHQVDFKGLMNRNRALDHHEGPCRLAQAKEV